MKVHHSVVWDSRSLASNPLSTASFNISGKMLPKVSRADPSIETCTLPGSPTQKGYRNLVAAATEKGRLRNLPCRIVCSLQAVGRQRYFIAATCALRRDLYREAVFSCSVPFWMALSRAETVLR